MDVLLALAGASVIIAVAVILARLSNRPDAEEKEALSIKEAEHHLYPHWSGERHKVKSKEVI